MNDPIEIPVAPKKSIQFTLIMTTGEEIGGKTFAAGVVIDSPLKQETVKEMLDGLSMCFLRSLKKKNLLEDQ